MAEALTEGGDRLSEPVMEGEPESDCVEDMQLLSISCGISFFIFVPPSELKVPPIKPNKNLPRVSKFSGAVLLL